jgi:hypothetical protein
VSDVTLRISGTLLLRAILRLPEDVTLKGAAVESEGDGHPVLSLTVDVPVAPEDAASVDVTYTRQAGLPDPVRVTGYRWLREDGTEIQPSSAAARP